VSSTIYNPTYVFAHEKTLVLPYSVSLAVTLILIATGLITMYLNGVSASSGFLQFLCTTSHTRGELQSLAMRNCLGGDNNTSDELNDLRVMYGQLDRDVSDWLVAGFLIEVDHVRKLTRRRR